MNKQIEALKMAIVALESIELLCDDKRWYLIGNARNACKEALAEAEKQEPVAWIEYKWEDEGGGLMYPVTYLHEYDNGNSKPLYTHPAIWQSLSDDEVKLFWEKSYVNGCLEFERITFFARAIEQALKDKNNG